MWHWPSLNVHFICSQPKAVWTGLTPSPACPRCTKGRHRCCFNSSHRFCWQLLHPSQHWQKGTRTPACQGKTRQALYLRYCWTFFLRCWTESQSHSGWQHISFCPLHHRNCAPQATAQLTRSPLRDFKSLWGPNITRRKTSQRKKRKLFLMKVFKR